MFIKMYIYIIVAGYGQEFLRVTVFLQHYLTAYLRPSVRAAMLRANAREVCAVSRMQLLIPCWF